MKRNLFLLVAVLLCSYSSALGWGRNGHASIAYIAECSLALRAKKTVEKILDDHSIVYYASWLDHVRTSPEDKTTLPWHVSAADCLVIYDLCIPGKKYSKQETAAFLLSVRPLAEEQVLKAGYRLARVLNELFG